jgi:hypothetical protein
VPARFERDVERRVEHDPSHIVDDITAAWGRHEERLADNSACPRDDVQRVGAPAAGAKRESADAVGVGLEERVVRDLPNRIACASKNVSTHSDSWPCTLFSNANPYGLQSAENSYGRTSTGPFSGVAASATPAAGTIKPAAAAIDTNVSFRPTCLIAVPPPVKASSASPGLLHRRGWHMRPDATLPAPVVQTALSRLALCSRREPLAHRVPRAFARSTSVMLVTHRASGHRMRACSPQVLTRET